MCFSCFSQLRPRYKRLVDEIFPALPQDGLVKSNMEKLTFYALSSPEKLDRIGEYLYQKASRDITRKREGFVKIAMEAMDQLLHACHAVSLNLFVESFLKMVQKLLECPEYELQILSTQSFIRFSKIEEDTPSYHRRYDFFVSKFSSMCHNNNQNPSIRDRIRLAGIKGLQGVIRKTVSDDLVENIWEPVHMDKIIPSLLYNMQNQQNKEDDDCLSDNGDQHELMNCNESDEKEVSFLAESCFRELVGRASFGHVKSVIRPVLRHFDLHNLWISKSFAIHCFRLIMSSIQSQYLYTVVESLMMHLDENSKLPTKIRTNVADVLSKIIAISAGESVGPTVLEIINSILTHLRTSVSRQNAKNRSDVIDEDEKQYQETLISALGEFAAHLPDYQKIEIMMFIMSKITHFKSVSSFSNIDTRIQHICLKSLKEAGIDISQLPSDVSNNINKNISTIHGHNWTDNGKSSSLTDVNFLELNSNSSSPCAEKKYPNEDLTFEAMKRVLVENIDIEREEEAIKNAELFEQFKCLPFIDLMKISSKNEENTLQHKLGQIFTKLSSDENCKTSSFNFEHKGSYKPTLENLFPECFVY